MAYKIAVASSDGKWINVSFGEAKQFLIYQVKEDKQISLLEIREYDEQVNGDSANENQGNSCGIEAGCGSGGGCHRGGESPKIALVQDCRSILCKRLGIQVRKQLERRAISAFDLDAEIAGTLEIIVNYFDRLDHHKTLAGFARH